jgi:hypothetical protein
MKPYSICLLFSIALACGASAGYNLHGIGTAIQLGIMSLVFGIFASAMVIADAIAEAKK